MTTTISESTLPSGSLLGRWRAWRRARATAALADCSLRNARQVSLGERLFRSVSEGDLEAVRQELDCGAPVDACSGGCTPLFIAALHGHLEVAALLLDRGADVNASMLSSKETPLHMGVGCEFMALGWGSLKKTKEIVGLLLAAGADTEACDVWGRRPIDQFIRLAEIACADPDQWTAVIREHRGRIDTALANKMAVMRTPGFLEVMALFRAHEEARALAKALDAQAAEAVSSRTRGRL